MSKLTETLNVKIAVYEPNKNMKFEKRTSTNSGTFKMLGQCDASITMKDGTVLFEKLRGFIGMYKGDNRNNSNIIVNYENAITGSNGNKYPNVKPSLELESLLKVETIKAYNKGFSETNTIDHVIAENAGIDYSKYVELSQQCIKKAAELAEDTPAPQQDIPEANIEEVGKEI